MTPTTFHSLLNELRALHRAEPALRDFCPMPAQVTHTPVAPRHLPCADLMTGDPSLTTPARYHPIRDAFFVAGPYALWRETYKGTRLGPDFMTRFACYCLIGNGGPFQSPDMQAYVVYMPANLYYPFHHHPAEELYFILAGQAAFLRDDRPAKTARPGDAIFHPSNAPHATQTHDHPVMALVLWRTHFETAPILTYPKGTR